jgi:hypothetical protein
MLFVVVAVIAAPEAGAARKPDLITKSAKIKSDIIFRATQEEQELVWKISGQNIGRKAAPKSTGGTKPDEIGFELPKLAPNESKTVGAIEISRLPASDFLYGPERLPGVADAAKEVPEANEHNNCRVSAVLYVIPFQLSGSVSGTEPFLGLSGVTEHWEGNATFQHFKTETVPGLKGVFLLSYELVSGHLDYQVSGSSGGSSYSGSGSPSLAPSTDCTVTLQINKTRAHRTDPWVYGSGSCLVTVTGFTFTVPVTVNGMPFPGASGPSSPIWLSMLGEVPLGFQHVSGSQSLPNGIQYTWDLAGQDGA